MAQNREIQLIFRILHKRYMKFEQVDMHDAISAGIHVRTLAVAAKINNMQKRLKALNKHFEKEADNTSC